MQRRFSLLLPALLVTAAALLLSAGAPSPAQAATKCKLSSSEQYPKNGVPTYNLSLTVTGTSCATGKKVAKAYHSCRPKKSLGCSKKLVGSKWKCTGRKSPGSIATQFSGTFTCKYGKRRVAGSFQQDT